MFKKIQLFIKILLDILIFNHLINGLRLHLYTIQLKIVYLMILVIPLHNIDDAHQLQAYSLTLRCKIHALQGIQFVSFFQTIQVINFY